MKHLKLFTEKLTLKFKEGDYVYYIDDYLKDIKKIYKIIRIDHMVYVFSPEDKGRLTYQIENIQDGSNWFWADDSELIKASDIDVKTMIYNL